MVNNNYMCKTDGCGNACRPLYSTNNPQASEWYCSKCNKSWKMSEQELAMFKHQVNNRGK